MGNPMILSGTWLAAGWTMIHFFWVGGLIGAFAALGCRLLRRSSADLRYLFLLGCLLALGIAPAALGWKMLSRGGPGEGRAQARAEPRGEPATASSEPARPAGKAVPPAAERRAVPRGRRPVPGASAVDHGLDRLALHLPWLWLAGAPLTFTWLLFGLSGAGRLRRRSRPPNDAALLDLFRRLREPLRLAGRAGLAVCDRIGSPVVLGILRPLVLLPSAALSGMTMEQVEMVLLHELAHVRRLDNLVNLLQRVLESLLFFHPAVWWTSGRARLEREAACDEFVVARTGKPLAYAEVIAAFALPGVQPPLVAALSGNQTVKRLRRILARDGTTLRIPRPLVAALAGLFLIPLGALAFFQSPPRGNALSPFAFHRFSDHGWGQGRIEAAAADYEGPEGTQITLVTEWPYAESGYYAEVDAILRGSDAVACWPSETGNGSRSRAERVRDFGFRVQDIPWAMFFGLENERSAVDRSRENMISPWEEESATGEEQPKGHETATQPKPGDLDLFLGWVRSDLESFASYAKRRWSWLWGDEEAEPAPLPVLETEDQGGGAGGVKFVLAREWACLFEQGWPTARPDSEDESLETYSNREILAKLDRLLGSGRKKIALYFQPGKLSELEALIARKPGFKLARKDWLTVWDAGD